MEEEIKKQPPQPDESKTKMDVSESPSPSPSSSFIFSSQQRRRSHSEANIRDECGSHSSLEDLCCVSEDDHPLFSACDDVASLKPRKHRLSNSVDGFGEIMEAKKAMSPHKLAHLWTVDPKRAKRILANRQSAARSKERKARYIMELEHQVQLLKTQATTLSAQLNLFQRDTTGLTTENTELKLQLRSMEQATQYCDVINEALEQEVDKLKLAIGGQMGGNIYVENPSMQMLRLSRSESNMDHHYIGNQMNCDSFVDLLQYSSIDRLQELDISSNDSTIFVRSEDGPALSISDCSSTF